MAAVKKPDVVATAKDLIISNTATLRNMIATLIVFAFQALVTNADIFKCPDKGNFVYGWMFILMPALVLFLMSLLLSESFKEETQGCLYTGDPTKQIVPKYLEVLKVFFYSLIISCLWIFWALLQKDYYTCAVFGSEDQVKNATGGNRTKLEQSYQKTQTESQIFGFTLLTLILVIPLLFITIRRCFYLLPLKLTSRLSRYECKKLEEQAAEEKLKELIEEYAKTQGEGKAQSFLAAQNITLDISSSEVYSIPINSQGKDKAWKEYEDNDTYDFVENVYELVDQQRLPLHDW